MATGRIIGGECVRHMAELPANTFDCVVTDPPYDLLQGSRRGSRRINKDPAANPYARHDRGNDMSAPKGFMGLAWDATGIAFKPETWLAVKRVLKPGGHLIAMGGTRTFHRLAAAIEDAGFEIRDTIMEFYASSDAAQAFLESLDEEQLALLQRALPADSLVAFLYGQGFPKGMDIAKQIDKLVGRQPEVIGLHPRPAGNKPGGASLHLSETGMPLAPLLTRAVSPQAQPWQGWNVALKPGFEPCVLARKEISETNVATNVLRWGTGGLNIEATRIGTSKDVPVSPNTGAGPGERYSGGWRDQNGATDVTGTTGWDPHIGRWPANVVLSHSVRCVKTGQREVRGRQINRFTDGAKPFGGGAGHPYEQVPLDDIETLDEWRCDADCPVYLLDQQSGERPAGGKVDGDEPSRTGQNGIYGLWERVENHPYDDEGTASRFFATFAGKPNNEQPSVRFRYTSKTSPSERWERMKTAGVERSHPTMKPLDLMRYLIRLVCPPGGHVLDPFAGSGSTLVAAIMEGMDATGIELSDEYLSICQARLDGVQIGGLF